MTLLIIEDVPHNSDSIDGFLAYEFAKNNLDTNVILYSTDFKITDSLINSNNFKIYNNFSLINLNKVDFLLVDYGSIGSINYSIQRKIDSSGVPVITFSLIKEFDINLINTTFINHIEHIINCNIDKLKNGYSKWTQMAEIK